MCDFLPKPSDVVIKKRECLKCQKEFSSAGDRICSRCTAENLKTSMRERYGSGKLSRRGYGVEHTEGS